MSDPVIVIPLVELPSPVIQPQAEAERKSRRLPGLLRECVLLGLLVLALIPASVSAAQSSAIVSGTDPSSGFHFLERSNPDWANTQIAINGASTAFALTESSTIGIYDMSFQRLGGLAGHSARIWSVDWNPRFPLIASGSEDTTVRIWNTDTLAPIQSIDLVDPVSAVAWDPTGTKLATLEDAIIAFDEDGGATTDNTLRIWDIANGGQMLQSFHLYNAPSALDWSADGTRLLMAGSDAEIGNQVFVLDVATAQIVESIPSPWLTGADVLTAEWSPSEQFIGFGTREVESEGVAAQAFVVGSEDSAERAVHHDFFQSVTSFDWSPNDSTAAIGGLGSTTVYIWNWPTDHLTYLEGHNSSISDVKWSSDGTYLVSASHDGTVRIWTVTLPDLSGTPTVTPFPTLRPTSTPTSTPTPANTAAPTSASASIQDIPREQYLDLGMPLYDVAWSPSGELPAVRANPVTSF